MSMPTSIIAIVVEVVSDSIVSVAYAGQYYEASIVDDTLEPVVGDLVVCEALPGSSQWVLAAIKAT